MELCNFFNLVSRRKNPLLLADQSQESKRVELINLKNETGQRAERTQKFG
jgi:hypothetical protein